MAFCSHDDYITTKGVVMLSPNRLGLVTAIKEATGREAIREYLPMQRASSRYRADVLDIEQEIGYRPRTPVRDGVARFVSWYRSYHGV